MDSGGLKEACIRWGPEPHERAIIRGKDMLGHTRQHSVVSCAKMAETIDLPFGLWSRVGQKKHKFNRIRQVAPMCPHGSAHLRNLANTIEPFGCCGLMSNYFDHLLLLLGRIAVLRARGLLLPTAYAMCLSVCHTSEPCKNG